MTTLEIRERKLRMSLMVADIENKRMDTEYKRGLLRFELWKVIAVAFGAGAALMGASVALMTFIFSRWPS